VAIAAVLSCSSFASGASGKYVPSIGISNQIGSNSEEWRAGYAFGLDALICNKGALKYGLRLGYQFAVPDAESMLQIENSDVQIERKEGSRHIFEVSLLGRYEMPCMKETAVGMAVTGCLGLNYVETSAVKLKGFYDRYETAVNREIHRDADSQIAPSITIGIDFSIAHQVQPKFEYQHIFTSGDASTGLFVISLGLLARK